ncbi:hypothetical protein [Knoellia sp. LjRoot47]|uniref:hypothetical protein n=1 Tax=Knoellia sp. LjRoot47 TaxID=3342330 RepID=UPI003ED10159
MTGQRWFDLWLALGQTLVGVAVTVLAVYLAAMAALRQDRRRAVAERSRTAAERILGVIDECQQRLMLAWGHVIYVLQPTPERMDDPRLAEVPDFPQLAKSLVGDLSRLKVEAGLLNDPDLRQQFDWAFKCALDLSLMVTATAQDPERFSARAIAENAGSASGMLGQFATALRAHLMEETAPVVAKPTHLTSPVRDHL